MYTYKRIIKVQKGGDKMLKQVFKPIDRTYKNNGQHLEQVVRYNLTGKLEKADNLHYDKFADVLDIQIKSARATVCKGTNLNEYLKNDKAKRYLYITADLQGYIMTKQEFILFCQTFGYITRESQKNGNALKIRLKSESKKLIEWLDSKVQPSPERVQSPVYWTSTKV